MSNQIATRKKKKSWAGWACTKTGRERSCYEFSCAFCGISSLCAGPSNRNADMSSLDVCCCLSTTIHWWRTVHKFQHVLLNFCLVVITLLCIIPIICAQPGVNCIAIALPHCSVVFFIVVVLSFLTHTCTIYKSLSYY